MLGRLFGSRRIFDHWQPLRLVEAGAAIGCLLLNVVVSVVGWWLWREDFITLKPGSWLLSVFDCLVMLISMDLGMYALHRFVHQPWLFPWFHRFHHRHETTNPISLFVLHPLEVMGFGALMIVFLLVYPMSLAGLVGYLTLNILWGTLGHSGVEPFPKWWASIPGLRLLGTSTFHAGHHEHPGSNFGFYTLIWDKLFGTLDPEYEAFFRKHCP